MLVILTTHPIQYQVPLWQALAKDGRVPFEVWYLTRHATDVSRDREFGKSFAWDLDMLKGYPYRFLKTPPGATPNTFWPCRIVESFPDLFKKTNTKAIWIQGWQVAAYWQAVWAAHNAGIEVWLRGESNDLAPTPFWKRAIKRVVLGQLFRRIDRFLYIGTANRRLYEKYGIARERLYSAPYAVDNERFAKQAEALHDSRLPAYAQGSGVAGRSGIRTQWKIPEDAFCVLFCGKFIPKKRPMDIIEAAKLLMRANQELKVHLLFVGSGELGGTLRAGCNVVFDKENQSAIRNPQSAIPNASFAGFLNQTEISKAYVVADCLVLPSDYRETWGLVVNEAMASGLPTIVSGAVGCAADLIEEGRTGFVFPLGDERELAARLAALVKLKAAGYDFACDLTAKMREFSPTATVSATLQAVEKLEKPRK